MKHIGTTTNNSYIVEMTKQEWHQIHNNDFHPESIREKISEYRKSRGVSQATFAAAVGISRNYLSQIERGHAGNISYYVYAAIVAECAKE